MFVLYEFSSTCPDSNGHLRLLNKFSCSLIPAPNCRYIDQCIKLKTQLFHISLRFQQLTKFGLSRMFWNTVQCIVKYSDTKHKVAVTYQKGSLVFCIAANIQLPTPNQISRLKLQAPFRVQVCKMFKRTNDLQRCDLFSYLSRRKSTVRVSLSSDPLHYRHTAGKVVTESLDKQGVRGHLDINRVGLLVSGPPVVRGRCSLSFVPMFHTICSKPCITLQWNS